MKREKEREKKWRKKTIRNQIALSSLLLKYRYCSANTSYLYLVSSVSSEFLKKQQGFFTITLFSLSKFIKLTEISICCHVAGPRATAPLARESKALENQSSNLVQPSPQLGNQKQKSRATFLENQKKKSRVAFSWVGKPEAKISCYFPCSCRTRSRNPVLLSLELENQKQKSSAPLGREPEAEIMSYFSFSWAKSRNLVLLSLQLESHEEKSCDTLS